MPQQIRVLQCFHCYLYQADIAKKSTKWQCRMCYKKQTVRKEYFQGTGAECRTKVQELNMARGKNGNEIVNSFVGTSSQLNESSFVKYNLNKDQEKYPSIKNKTHTSTKKWASCLQNDKESNREISKEISITTPPKKSKWDDYV